MKSYILTIQRKFVGTFSKDKTAWFVSLNAYLNKQNLYISVIRLLYATCQYYYIEVSAEPLLVASIYEL